MMTIASIIVTVTAMTIAEPVPMMLNADPNTDTMTTRKTAKSDDMTVTRQKIVIRGSIPSTTSDGNGVVAGRCSL